MLQIINENGLITKLCGPEFSGLKRFQARKNIINSLENLQLFRGSQDHQMSIPICSRSKDIIEYLLKPQWFVNSTEMAQKACTAVKKGDLIIEPQSFEKNWFNWLENIRDWNISRQLWWGHQIPAYRCSSLDDDQKKIWVAAETEANAKEKAVKLLGCENVIVKQDDDVLDTWFSSGLMPFSVFGWPDQVSSYLLALRYKL